MQIQACSRHVCYWSMYFTEKGKYQYLCWAGSLSMRNGGVHNGEFWVPVQCFGDTVVEMLQDVEITYAKIIQCKIT